MLSSTHFVAIGALLASLTAAQLPTLPSCAQACVVQFTSGSNIGTCDHLDFACICENKNFLSGIACCLSTACDAADQLAATTYAQDFCGVAGVTDLPTAVSCTSTASSTASGAPSSTSGTATSVTSSVPTSSSSSEPSTVTSSSVSAASPSNTNAASHNVAGVGARVLGGLVAAAALL